MADPDRHAIELRISAEDPARAFAPTPGRIARWREPAGPGVRVDSGVEEGMLVSGDYDPLLAKILVVAADRDGAIARARRALAEMETGGIQTTAAVPCAGCCEHPAFVAGRRADRPRRSRLGRRRRSASAAVRRAIEAVAARSSRPAAPGSRRASGDSDHRDRSPSGARPTAAAGRARRRLGARGPPGSDGALAVTDDATAAGRPGRRRRPRRGAGARATSRPQPTGAMPIARALSPRPRRIGPPVASGTR